VTTFHVIMGVMAAGSADSTELDPAVADSEGEKVIKRAIVTADSILFMTFGVVVVISVGAIIVSGIAVMFDALGALGVTLSGVVVIVEGVVVVTVGGIVVLSNAVALL